MKYDIISRVTAWHRGTVAMVESETAEETGVSIVELAIVLPVLILFIAGILQFGYLLATHVVLRQAAVTAGREALLSLPRRTDDEIRATVEAAIQPLLAVDRLEDVQLDRNFVVNNSAGAVRIELLYEIPPFIPIIFTGRGPQGEFQLRVAYIMR